MLQIRLIDCCVLNFFMDNQDGCPTWDFDEDEVFESRGMIIHGIMNVGQSS